MVAGTDSQPRPPLSNRLGRYSTSLTIDTLLEVALLDRTHLRQARLALELLLADTPVFPNPDLDQLQITDIRDDQSVQVTRIIRRLLAAKRVLGGQGTVMLIRGALEPTAQSSQPPVHAIAYIGAEPGGLNRILLYSPTTDCWTVSHLSIYVLQRLHSHFTNGILFETPSLRYPLEPLPDDFSAHTRNRIAKIWTSNRLSDRLLAIQKLGRLMPALYFAVVDQFLRGDAIGAVDKAFQFAIIVPGISFPQEKLVNLPFFQQRRQYR